MGAADTKLAKVGITVKEPWANDISYEVLDYTLWRVQDGGDGCGYIALKDNIGVTPNTDPLTWRKATEAGQSIYDLAVKYGHFVGTEEEFEAQYQAALAAANSAAAAATGTNQQVQAAEAGRVTAENARATAETGRQTAETNRANAESSRVSAETSRANAESSRATAETARAGAETQRQSNESSRVSAENARDEAELSRAQTFAELETDMQTAIGQADAATAKASNVNATIDGTTVTITDKNGVSTSVDIGFDIYKTYASVAAMNADAENVEEGKFVMIATTDTTSAENARLYVRNENAASSESPFTFLCDLDQAASSAWADWFENYKPTIEADHTRAEGDHTQASTDHGTAAADHTQAGNDHTRAESDHSTAASDHTQAGTDHTTAAADHTTAGTDHTTAAADHTQAESDHTRAESDHASIATIGDKVDFIETSFGKYDAIRGVTLTRAKDGKYVNVDGGETSASGYGISNPVELNFGDMLLVPSASAVPASVSVVSRIVTRTYQKVINYTYTYQQANPELYDTATADYDSSLVYAAVYDTTGETPVLTGWTKGGQTYNTLPATHDVTESYYEPLVKQAVSAMPSTGYYIYLCPSDMTIVISGYTATVNGGVCLTVGWGIFKNIVSNFLSMPGQNAVAQALCDLDARLLGIAKRLENLGDTKAKCIDFENIPKVCDGPMVIEGVGSPSVLPRFVGQRYHDTTNNAKHLYEAFSVTGNLSDWVLIK